MESNIIEKYVQIKAKKYRDGFSNDPLVVTSSEKLEGQLGYRSGLTAGIELMGEFTEWANQNFAYVEKDKWDADNDEIYTTAQLIELFLNNKMNEK